MHARPRAFPFVSLNFRTVSDRLRRKKKGVGYRAPFLFFSGPSLMTSVAAQLSRTADCFRARFRGYNTHILPRLRSSPHRVFVRENLEIYSVPCFFFFFSFSYFLSKFGKSFWFKRYDSRIIGCRLKSLLNQKYGKRRYVPRYEQRFILHILHIFPRLEQLAIHSWHVMQQRWASLSWNATCPGAVNEPREGCGWLGLRMEKK